MQGQPKQQQINGLRFESLYVENSYSSNIFVFLSLHICHNKQGPTF